MDLQDFLKRLHELNIIFQETRVSEAYRMAETAHAGQFRSSGEPYVSHPIQVALILAELELDEDTVIAGLLHDVIEDTQYTHDSIQAKFGKDVAEIVEGVTKIERIQYESLELQQAENFRKMLLAMSKDVRVIMVKLADRLHNMRTLKYKSDASKAKTAEETLEIYVPIAHRLGIFRVKWELEDLSFLYKEPDKYRELVAKVDLRRREREKNIQDIIRSISSALNANKIEHTIYGRPKNLYSIYKKMTFKNYSFEEIHDLTAIRVIVKEVSQCYGVLGIIHSKWKPIPGRFKDYIAMPKPNMYQSLHTTLLNDNGETFEVQIRTEDMHRVAEFGIAAHWRYKDRSQVSGSNLSWLEQMVEWQTELDNPTEFINSVKMDLFNMHVYVFTPKGSVIELPDGATPVDFAYKIHTDVGHACVGAKVNSRIVPLNYVLKIGDIVEILTSKTPQGPSRDWLSFVKSSQAKNKIRAYFKRQNYQENIEKGKDMIERELKKYRLTLKQVMTPKIEQSLIDKLTVKNMESLYSSVGYGDILVRQIMPTIREEFIQEDKPLRVSTKPKVFQDQGVTIQGMDDMMVRFAKCCNPIRGDAIIGYITRGSGITIHRANCTNFNPEEEQSERFIDVQWSGDQPATFTATAKIIGADRPGLLSDITSSLQNQHTAVRGLNAKVNNNQITTLILNFDVKDVDELNRILAKLRHVPNVSEVSRL